MLLNVELYRISLQNSFIISFHFEIGLGMVPTTPRFVVIIIAFSSLFLVFTSNLITNSDHFALAKRHKTSFEDFFKKFREHFREHDDDKKRADKKHHDDDKHDDNKEQKVKHHYTFADEGDTKRETFNFVAAGDFGCSKNAKKTVSNMKDKEPELVLPLGDLSYDKTATCWLDLVSAFDDKLKATFGYHDVNDGGSKLNQYKQTFGLKDKLYGSFDYRHVHFITMATESNFGKNSDQYKFIEKDLKEVSQNRDVDWIVVTSYGPFYSSPSAHDAKTDLRNTYHPLFEKYGVDLVLEAHNHNYQRTYPLVFNPDKTSKPRPSNEFTTGYNAKNDGIVFAIVGTGGESFYPLDGRESYVATQFGGMFGFMNIEISNGNPHTKLIGTFYDNKDNEMQDHFTIVKEIKNKHGNNQDKHKEKNKDKGKD